MYQPTDSYLILYITTIPYDLRRLSNKSLEVLYNFHGLIHDSVYLQL